MPAKKAARKPVTKPSKPEDRPTPRMEFIPEAREIPDPKAETKPSGAIMATVRAFNPSRVGAGKTIGASAMVLAYLAFLFALDNGIIPADGTFALFVAGAVGPMVGLALRHLGSRWKA